MSNERIAGGGPGGPGSAEAVILEARGVEKRFGGVRALSGIDFSLRQGELRCLIGPNGAGKSTFFKLLSGQLNPTEGDILFQGQSISGAQQHAIAKRGMGIKNQVPTVLDGLSVDENLWLAARSVLNAHEASERADRIKTRLGLRAASRKLVGELAHGQRQWVEIGMVIARDPKVILFDEPAAGMSDEETDRMVELIRELNEQAAIVVVEHDMAFIGKIARQVTVFHQGRILMEGTFDEVVGNQRVRDVYLGRGQDT
ncbi:ABC transporter ATP-binding protein [Alcaligenaceae bacterium]|nr:ABC transporter ATP-binding protein [Alcaligenaceae bacterium]